MCFRLAKRLLNFWSPAETNGLKNWDKWESNGYGMGYPEYNRSHTGQKWKKVTVSGGS
jgi:hypothetical protein